MRSQRTARESSTSHRRSALVVNSLDLVGEWLAHRRKTSDSIGPTMRALLNHVDFDRVRRGPLLQAVGLFLTGLPTDALADVSDAADAERRILVECIGDREIGVSDDQLVAKMSAADRRLVWLLDGLRTNPDAFRAAVDLIEALGGKSTTGLGVNAVFGRRQQRTSTSGSALDVVHQRHERGSRDDSGYTGAGAEHEEHAGLTRQAAPATRYLGGR